MKNKKMALTLLLLSYVLFFADCKGNFKTKTKETTFEYNGLLWIGLDYFSIFKYDSKDEPKKFFTSKTIKL